MEQPTAPDPTSFPASHVHALTITVAEQDGWLELHVRGEVDAESGRHLGDFLDAALEQSDRVLVDLAKIEFIDSTGLAILVGAHKRAVAREGLLVVRDPAPGVLRILEVSGVAKIVPIDVNGHRS